MKIEQLPDAIRDRCGSSRCLHSPLRPGVDRQAAREQIVHLLMERTPFKTMEQRPITARAFDPGHEHIDRHIEPHHRACGYHSHHVIAGHGSTAAR